ncbi:hypothetical protein C8A01DRAFT_50382 [Parachaetomium inaequale]|uniref:Uncharacterized protein n=1 Tax=Parachaetomium inaequale TaxID=2588326 RepID=A0AAN6P8V6_9PEZI|nr:hypothetical protein C8A01DRAFT_50382 [Parachaetomium inaequale]
MAATETSFATLMQLELVKKRDLTAQGVSILQALAHGLQPATPEAAAEAAHQLDRLCPPLEDSDQASDYLWGLWEIIMAIAGSPDVESEVHERLVEILRQLKQHARGELGFSLDPTSTGAEFTQVSAQIWRNISLFGARYLAERLLGAYLELAYTLRDALEQDLDKLPDVGIAECRIQVACGWIQYAAKPLLRWAWENMDSTNGSFYCGPSAVCLERWRFWLGRFDELANEDSGLGEETRKAASEAAETMRAVEKLVDDALS